MEEKYVLLIDGDNVNCSYLAPFIEYIQQHYGEVSTIHLFGNLDSRYLKDWEQLCNLYSGKKVCYNISETRKNSTDIHMIHIAWKLFYGGGIRNFAIMSSDSDMGAVVSELNTEATVLIGYSHHKVSEKYLQSLEKQNVACVDMDELRGALRKDALSQAINCTMRSYLEFRLAKERFSYNTLITWISERYPELTNISKEELVRHLAAFKVSFTEDGAVVTPVE